MLRRAAHLAQKIRVIPRRRNRFDKHTEHTEQVGVTNIQSFRQILREPKKSRAEKRFRTYRTYSQHTKPEKFVCTKKQALMRLFAPKHTQHTIFSPRRRKSEGDKARAHTRESLIRFA
nr:MAG TPA: hypothetical protein [Caudoviricetes sp.]